MIAEIGSVTNYDGADVVCSVQYSYRVAAFNSLYQGDRSSQVSATPYNVPSAPTGVTVSSGVRNLTVTWSAPSSDNGGAVLGYRVLVWAPGARPEALLTSRPPKAPAMYSVAAINGNASVAPTSMSQSVELSAGSTFDGAVMSIVMVAVGGFLIFLILFRRRKE
jgi:hypothetical protein